MTEAAPAIFAAIEASAFAATVRQSPWAYMVANVGHILSLMIFFGAVAVMDLRLAGAFAATSPEAVLRRGRIVAVIGFLGLIGTGAVLFSAEATHVIVNPIFQIKAAFIALGLLNIGWFEFFVAPRIKDIRPHRTLPAAARISGIASIVIWLATAASGRLIAYF